MRAPFEVGCRPARSTRIPAFAFSSLYFVIAAIRLSSGIMPASESLLVLTNIINRIDLSSFEYHAGGKRTTATGGSRASGIVQESPPSYEIHKPPLVATMARRWAS